MNYRNSICTFRVTGKALREMMQFHVRLPEGLKCQISGFTLSYNSHENPQRNDIVDWSLDPEKEYLVATSDYLAERSKSFFGRQVEYCSTGLQVNEAMVRWFEEHHRIDAVAPRVRIVRVPTDG